MKALKLVAIPVLGLVVIAVIIAYFLLSNLDDIIKRVVEDVGSQVTQTNVTLDSAHLDLKTGRGSLTGLMIANPPGTGYKSAYALQLDNIVLAVDLESLREPVIVITEVTVDGARLIAEQKGGKTNLSELLDNIDAASQESGVEPDQGQEEASASDVHLMLENFAFINTSATLISEELGEKSLEIPDVRRTNIGDKETGLTPDQVADKLLRSVIREVTKEVRDYLRELAKEALLGDKLSEDNIKKKFKSLFKRGD